jgi:hypothetical protein
MKFRLQSKWADENKLAERNSDSNRNEQMKKNWVNETQTQPGEQMKESQWTE